jgi:hypothetical protein
METENEKMKKEYSNYYDILGKNEKEIKSLT